MSVTKYSFMQCPECNSRNIGRIVYGLLAITPEIDDKLSTGELHSGGCCVIKDKDGILLNPNWHCNDCGSEWNQHPRIFTYLKQENVHQVDTADYTYWTLNDLFPESDKVKFLVVGKCPSPVSVFKGHYYQGRQGKGFWKRLEDVGILSKFPSGHNDEKIVFLGKFGFTDLVKRPHPFRKEPTDLEYYEGCERTVKLLNHLKPICIVFVYKKVLDVLLKFKSSSINTNYGFNPHIEDVFKAKVFVFPMPGTPANMDTTKKVMAEFRELYKSINPIEF